MATYVKERLSQSTKIVSSRLIQTKRSLITLLFSFSRIKATLTTTYCTSPLLAKDIIKLGFYWNWLTSSAWYILVAPIKGLSSICTGLICPVAGRKLSWMFRTVWQKLSRFQLTFSNFSAWEPASMPTTYPICILSINMIFSSCFQIKYGCS